MEEAEEPEVEEVVEEHLVGAEGDRVVEEEAGVEVVGDVVGEEEEEEVACEVFLHS